jgi:transposase
VEVRRVGWETPLLDEEGRRVFRPIRHAWRVEVAHGRIGRARRLSKSFEKTTASASGWLQVACLMLVLRAP